MKLHIFGTCSGTEPEPGRHHVSFAVDHRDRLHWFDAGECCSYTAHLMGVDILRTRRIVISHTHMDHIGGLPNLFWTIRKLDGMHHALRSPEIYLHIPELRAWEAMENMLSYTEGGFRKDFSILASEFEDGPLYEDDGLAVEALHTRHLPRAEGEPWRAFGFAVTDGEKKFVYSGDTKGVEDFAPLMEGCDLLLMETGHHHPAEIVRELQERGLMPGKLAFIHHGRDILDHYEREAAGLRELAGDRAVILEDATTLII